MKATYDKYYLTANLFGDPYPELMEFFTKYPKKGRVLDLGCGQGRNAIALARLGYSVTGIDISKVGIDQLNQIGQSEKLNLIGQIGDIYTFNQLVDFDIVLLDSMFHFAKKDKEKEIGLIKRIVSALRIGSLLVICIQDTVKKVQILNRAIDIEQRQKRLVDKSFNYIFKDKKHQSESPYRMLIIEIFKD